MYARNFCGRFGNTANMYTVSPLLEKFIGDLS